MLAAVRDKDAMTKARAVCGFVNTQFHSATDMELYNFPDYWAAPVEMTDKGAGDSEDFAIIKYFALRALGFSADDIRLLIVKMGSGSRATWSALLGVRVDGNFFVQDFDFRPADLLLPANEAMSRLYHLTIAFNEDGVWYYR
jgi:predicted transglutaminase-like cysteine proteinase